MLAQPTPANTGESPLFAPASYAHIKISCPQAQARFDRRHRREEIPLFARAPRTHIKISCPELQARLDSRHCKEDPQPRAIPLFAPAPQTHIKISCPRLQAKHNSHHRGEGHRRESNHKEERPREEPPLFALAPRAKVTISCPKLQARLDRRHNPQGLPPSPPSSNQTSLASLCTATSGFETPDSDDGCMLETPDQHAASMERIAALFYGARETLGKLRNEIGGMCTRCDRCNHDTAHKEEFKIKKNTEKAASAMSNPLTIPIQKCRPSSGLPGQMQWTERSIRPGPRLTPEETAWLVDSDRPRQYYAGFLPAAPPASALPFPTKFMAGRKGASVQKVTEEAMVARGNVL